jgi:Restriction endonuclease fold toxin 2
MAPGAGGYTADVDTIFRSSVQFLDTKNFVHDIAEGVVGDLSVSAGMAGDDNTAHSFAAKYEPAAVTLVKTIGQAGQGMAAISSRLLTMAATYLQQEDAVAGALLGKNFDSASAFQQAPECDSNEAYNSLPMVTGSKEVHEIPVIGRFWPQGSPDKLRATAQVWAKCASLIDDAQANAGRHTAPIKAHCSGEAFDRFFEYAATVYTASPQGGTAVGAGAPLLENVSAGCRLMHNMCNDYADAIDMCRTILIGLGIGAGLIAAGGLLLTIVTLGGSDVAAGAGEAALAAEAAAAAEALAVTEAGAASAAAVAEAEAIVASAASRLIITAAAAGAGVAVATVPADAAPVTSPPGGSGIPGGPIGPVPPPVPPAFPLYDATQLAAAQQWMNGLGTRPAVYGSAEDIAYQKQVAGEPERLMEGNGFSKYADGFRPEDGAIIEAKNVRGKEGCSPRTLDKLQEGNFISGKFAKDDGIELAKYQTIINNPVNHAQYLEIDTADPSTVGYWQFLAAQNHVTNNVRYIPAAR